MIKDLKWELEYQQVPSGATAQLSGEMGRCKREQHNLNHLNFNSNDNIVFSVPYQHHQ